MADPVVVPDSRPDSSEKEHPVFNGEVAGLSPARGSTFHYAIMRKELSGGALLAQVFHAGADSVKKHLEGGGEYPHDTRAVILVATKEQLAEVVERLRSSPEEFTHLVVQETDGPLAGSITAVSVITEDRDALKPILGHLRPWRA